MFFGLVVGAILAGITFALSSIIVFIAPAVTIALAVPNIIAAGAYFLGMICLGFENCFSFFAGKNNVQHASPVKSTFTPSYQTNPKNPSRFDQTHSDLFTTFFEGSVPSGSKRDRTVNSSSNFRPS